MKEIKVYFTKHNGFEARELISSASTFVVVILNTF